MKTTLKTLTIGMPLVCAAVLSFLLIPCAAHARLNAWDTEKALFFGKWQESATDKGLGIAAGWHDFGDVTALYVVGDLGVKTSPLIGAGFFYGFTLVAYSAPSFH